MRVTCCSCLHKGANGHPADDATPGWREAWARVPDPKLCLGDMAELWQFRRDQIPAWVGTDVDGNHDRGLSGKSVIRVGDTFFLHGRQFDSWPIRLLGRPVAWLVGRLEWVWPDADLRLADWFMRTFEGGRHGRKERYARAAARYARWRGARQIVMGHLHRRFDTVVDGVRVVCVGCCCNGRLDFVEVEVRTDS